MTQPWLQTDFIKDIYLAIAKDADEQPTREGVEYLLEIARRSPQDYLQLRRARLGPTSTLQLSKRLEGVSLSTLDVFENAIKDVGFMALLKYAERHFTMQRLNVGCCGITNEGAMALGEILKEGSGLEAIELGYPSGYIFQKVRKNLKTALINQLTSESIAYVAKNLAHNQTLKYLGISHNLAGIGSSNEGASQLGIMLTTNQTLTALDVSYNLLQNTGATSIFRGLTQNIGLQKLMLNGNGISFLSIPLLSTILSGQQCGLVELSLDDNPLGIEGAKALAYGLAQNSSLKKLSLNNCALDDDGASIIAATLTHPLIDDKELLKSRFSLDNNDNDTDKLVDLMTDFFDRIVDKQREQQGDKKIFVLNHQGRVMSATTLKKIPRQREISHQPSSSKMEETLNFNQFMNENIQNDDSENSFGEGQYNATPEVNLETTSDNLVTQTMPTNTVFPDYLGSTLSKTQDNDDFQSSTTIPSTQFSAITHLSLGFNNININGVQHISRLLKSNCQIHSINLQGNKIQNQGAILLAETLIYNQINLRKFENQPNYIPKDEITETNGILTHLDLSKCSISDAGFVALSYAISQCANMISFNFEDNFVGEVGGLKGCQFLLKSNCLLVVNLRGNQVAHFSVQNLGLKLSENKAKITMNAPKRLKQRIIDMKSQSQRLGICKEELEFLLKSIQLVQGYNNQIQSQKDECNDQNYRQNTNLKAKEEAQKIAIKGVETGIQEGQEKSLSLEGKLVVQQQENKVNLANTQLKSVEIEAELEVVKNQISAKAAERANLIADLEKQIQQEADMITEIQTNQTYSHKLMEMLKIKFKDQINKALVSQVPIKLSIQYDYNQLITSVKRMEKVASGAVVIGKIADYNPLTFDFAPPKAEKGKSGKKGKKAKKGKKLERVL